MAEKTEPIDIPKKEKEKENENTKSSKYSLSYWLRSTEKKEPIPETPISTCPPEDNGIFSMSSNSEEDNEEFTDEPVTESECESTYDPWDEAPRKNSCCRKVSKQLEKFTGYNSEPLITTYEVVYDKAQKDLDKILEKCTADNFNKSVDTLLRNFANNFHWFLWGVWFHSLQKNRVVTVPIYVSDCGHVCAEI